MLSFFQSYLLILFDVDLSEEWRKQAQGKLGIVYADLEEKSSQSSIVTQLTCNYADIGDFGSAGAAQFQLVRKLDQAIVKAEVGEYRYYRSVAAMSQDVGAGSLLLAVDFSVLLGSLTL